MAPGCRKSPRSASPAWTRPAPARKPSPGSSAASGRSSPCTGSATPFTAKMTHESGPDPDPGPWPPSGTWPSAPCTSTDATTPPKPPDGPADPSTGPSQSSDSINDLETAVAEVRSIEPHPSPLGVRDANPAITMVTLLPDIDKVREHPA